MNDEDIAREYIHKLTRRALERLANSRCFPGKVWKPDEINSYYEELCARQEYARDTLELLVRLEDFEEKTR